MLKTICIKTKSKKISEYLLKELEYFDLQSIHVSCYKFKIYTNIIIHYKGKNAELFLNKISTLLAYLVIDFYEPSIIQNLINTNYFYFSTDEKKDIYNLCLTNIDFKTSLSIINIISQAFYEYFSFNKYVILDGFVNFKLKSYIKELDTVVDMCVNKFIIDREYNEFVSLIKTYIQTTPSNTDEVHLIYKNQTSILLDSSKNVIPYNDKLINNKYLSDISFSSNDYALNSLLSLLPQKLYIHLIDTPDEFVSTLEKIFDKRIYICTECDLCTLYKSQTPKYNFNRLKN